MLKYIYRETRNMLIHMQKVGFTKAQSHSTATKLLIVSILFPASRSTSNKKIDKTCETCY